MGSPESLSLFSLSIHFHSGICSLINIRDSFDPLSRFLLKLDTLEDFSVSGISRSGMDLALSGPVPGTQQMKEARGFSSYSPLMEVQSESHLKTAVRQWLFLLVW